MTKLFLVLFSLTLQACGDSFFLEDQIRKKPGQIKSIENNLEFIQSEVELDALWQISPKVAEEAKLVVVLKSPNSLENLNLKAKLWMPDMGHGSYPISIKKLGPGVFELSEMFFSMKGNWDLHLQLYHQDLFMEEIKWAIEL